MLDLHSSVTHTLPVRRIAHDNLGGMPQYRFLRQLQNYLPVNSRSTTDRTHTIKRTFTIDTIRQIRHKMIRNIM